MNTEKKNQHYIPKFYLRNFSYNRNDAQIGVFNVNNEFFFQTAKLKTQGSKNFFYGHDGIIEDKLSDVEGRLATTIRNIINTESLPRKGDNNHYALLAFVGLTHLRNPVQIELLKQSRTAMRERFNEILPNENAENHIPEITHQEAVRLALSGLQTVVENIMDLDYKLLKNNTELPFITSDFPVVKYNRYLESKKWMHGKTGYGNTGLQIFIPLNSKLTLVFYDSMIYKVGYKKREICDIENVKDIEQLNILQILNCFETLFFDHECPYGYISKLFQKSLRFNRANKIKSHAAYSRKEHEEPDPERKKNLIIMGSTDCEINLDIQGIKIHSGSLKVKMHPSIAQIRPLTKLLRSNRH